MASDLDFVTYVCDQLRGLGSALSYRRMFGEFALYHGETVVALVCDNQLFVKPTPGGRALIDSPVEAAPYKGAKPYFLVVDEIEDGEWLARLFRTTAQELPVPKKAKRKQKTNAKQKAKAKLSGSAKASRPLAAVVPKRDRPKSATKPTSSARKK